MMTPIRALLTAALVVLGSIAPAGATPDAGATNLADTTWKVRASQSTRMKAGGETINNFRRHPGVGTVEFIGDEFVVVDPDGESLSGVWSGDPDKLRRFAGTLNFGETREIDEKLDRILSKMVRRELGKRASLELNPQTPEMKGRVSRGGGRIRLKLKLRYDAFIHFRGRRLRVRVGTQLHLQGKRLDD
jgi:hypothetical protein